MPDLIDVMDSIVMGAAENFAQQHCEEYYTHAVTPSIEGVRTLPYVVLSKYVFGESMRFEGPECSSICRQFLQIITADDHMINSCRLWLVCFRPWPYYN